MQLFEILCICLVIFSFYKNIANWKDNLILTFIFLISGFILIKTISFPNGLTTFMAGVPACIGDSCMHWGAFTTLLTGQILWGYYTQSITNTMAAALYLIHMSPPLSLIFGFVRNWDFRLQITTDLFLILICMAAHEMNQRKPDALYVARPIKRSQSTVFNGAITRSRKRKMIFSK